MSGFINNKFFNGSLQNDMVLNLLDAFLTLLVLFILSKIIIKIIEKVLRSSKANGKVFVTAFQLLRNVVRVLFFIMGLFTVLEIFGVNTASLVATAGIGGVAIGFGAQFLVKDIISGFFILLEGQYYVGDEVVIEGITGNIVDFSMRTTKLRDFDTGAIHVIPNGKINIVENRSRVDQLANITLDVPNFYDPDLVIGILKESLESLKDDRIIKGPFVRGISGFKDRYYSIFINTTVKNGEIYEMQRVLRKIITEDLRKNNISLYRPIIELEGENL